jgi:hypothetical protein
LLTIDHDASSEEVTTQTVQAIKEAALHVGKLDRHFEAFQVTEMEAALALLQNALRLKS